MRIKIKKSVYGEPYTFRVYIDAPKNTHVSIMCCLERLSGVISSDFSKITLNEPITLKGYADGYDVPKTKVIKELKLSRYNRFDIKEYFEGR